MGYGPGESAKIWTELFKDVRFLEYDANCTRKYIELGKIRPPNERGGYTVYTGDQSDMQLLENLKEKMNYSMGIVIDDGGHFNYQILASFHSLWPSVKPKTGMYFVEDMGASAYHPSYDVQPVLKEGEEKPGTAQWCFKELLENVMCKFTNKSCHDLELIDCQHNICLFRKV